MIVFVAKSCEYNNIDGTYTYTEDGTPSLIGMSLVQNQPSYPIKIFYNGYEREVRVLRAVLNTELGENSFITLQVKPVSPVHEPNIQNGNVCICNNTADECFQEFKDKKTLDAFINRLLELRNVVYSDDKMYWTTVGA